MDLRRRHAARHLSASGAAQRTPPAVRRLCEKATNSLKEPSSRALSTTVQAQNFTSTFQHFRETQMHQLLTSIVLCLVAHTAAAQCVDTTPLAVQVHSGAGLIRTAAAAPDAAARPNAAAGGELIKTAAAGPREVAMRQTPPVSGTPKPQASDQEQPRRTEPAMLLAALAVMTAIALRRSGGSGQ